MGTTTTMTIDARSLFKGRTCTHQPPPAIENPSTDLQIDSSAHSVRFTYYIYTASYCIASESGSAGFVCGYTYCTAKVYA